MTGYYRSIGCDRDPFNFFGSPPPECGAIAQRIRMMEANYAALAAQGDDSGGDVDARRQQLLAAIQQTCQPQRDAAVERPRGLLESLFGGQSRRAPGVDEDRGQADEGDDGDRPARALGGRKVVCVRACDGFFFPLSNLPDGREGADSLCQALCPNTEAAAYYMPPSGEIENAVSSGGKPYAQLANASKYKKSFDASCSCKKADESWAQALARAEDMIDRRRDDIVVTAQKAEELSRPKLDAAPSRPKDKPKKGEKAAAAPNAAPVPASPSGDNPESQAEAESGEAAPTASRESAGIGPQSIEGTKVLGRGDGQKRDVTSAGGAKRTVRTLTPGSPPPQIQ